MVCHHPCRNRSSDSSGFPTQINHRPIALTARKRKQSRDSFVPSTAKAKPGISSNNYKHNRRPLFLLRAIVMATTIWYCSVGVMRGRTPSMLVANAWTIPSLRSISNARRKAIPKIIHHNPISTSRFRDSDDCIQTRWPIGHHHRLFSTTTVVDGDSESHIAKEKNKELEDWKASPMVNPTITFETLLVPNSQLTKWITHPGLQHKLAKADNWEFLRHVHPRIKMVQDYKGETSNDDTAIQCKQLLLLPSSTKLATANHTATGLLASEGASEETQEGDTQWLTELLSEEAEETGASIRLGPTRPMTIAPNQLSFQYILKTLLPESALPPPSAYEQIGHVAHFNLKERHLPFKRLIGSALLESTTSGADSIQTVVNKVGQVDGKFRTYECEILADVHPKSNVNGVDTADNTSSSAVSSSLETTVVEDGIAIELNVAECYWCTRLSGERRELIKDILKGRRKPKKPKTGGNLAPPLVVADVFCGAGAICMLLGKKIKEQDKLWKQEQQPHHQQQQQQQHPSLTVLANDWNPRAIEYMKRSIATNGMGKEKDQCMYHRFELSCRDSYDFLSELGEEQQTTRANPYVKKKLARKSISQAKPKDPEPEQLPQQPLMPDHILMNFPLEAPQFLGALRWWSWKRIEDEGIRRQNRFGGSNNGGDWCPRFHVYTFARSSSPRADDEAEMAVNLVANELLPQPFFDDDDDLPDTKATEASSSSLSTPAYRRDELNGEFGTDFATRIVRDVAPGKVVVLVSFSVTPKLIRYMQGDFS